MSDEQWQRPPDYVRQPGALWVYPPAPQQPQPPAWAYPPPQQNWWTPTPPPVSPPTPPRRSRRLALSIAAVTTGIAVAIGGTVIATTETSGGGNQTSAFSPSQPTTQLPQQGTGGTGSTGTGGTGSTGQGGTGSSGQGQFGGGQTSPYGSGGTTTTGGQATTTQQVGVVDINTVLDYGTAQAAGTGLVLSSNGEILTNNHVIDGSTSISVTIVSTGKTYTATVVGTDPTDDVAVLKLSGASGLATAKLGDSSKVAVGNTVTAVGNAGGTGGIPSSATGTVTGLNQSLTATDDDGSNSENLTGMIEVNADIQAGDSGGPLYAANGTIIGIDTAASSSRSSQTTGYAIPIAKATSIAKQIESGTSSSTIHQGYPAFLGVQLSSTGSSDGSFGGTGSTGGTGTTGATIAGVVDNSGAANAGLGAGDTITALNGTTISSASDLSTVVAGFKPGQQISISWVDSSGQAHTGTLTLGSGPAD